MRVARNTQTPSNTAPFYRIAGQNQPRARNRKFPRIRHKLSAQWPLRLMPGNPGGGSFSGREVREVLIPAIRRIMRIRNYIRVGCSLCGVTRPLIAPEYCVESRSASTADDLASSARIR